MKYLSYVSLWSDLRTSVFEFESVTHIPQNHNRFYGLFSHFVHSLGLPVISTSFCRFLFLFSSLLSSKKFLNLTLWSEKQYFLYHLILIHECHNRTGIYTNKRQMFVCLSAIAMKIYRSRGLNMWMSLVQNTPWCT